MGGSGQEVTNKSISCGHSRLHGGWMTFVCWNEAVTVAQGHGSHPTRKLNQNPNCRNCFSGNENKEKKLACRRRLHNNIEESSPRAEHNLNHSMHKSRVLPQLYLLHAEETGANYVDYYGLLSSSSLLLNSSHFPENKLQCNSACEALDCSLEAFLFPYGLSYCSSLMGLYLSPL